jgi:hypothetical protein
MQIVIERVVEQTPDGPLIEFSTALGPGRGVWWDYNPPPKAGDGYSVEMDILDEIRAGDVAVLDDVEDMPQAYRLEWRDGWMIIQGKIDTLFDMDGNPSGVSIDVRSRMDNVVFSIDLPELAVYRYRFARLAAERIGLADQNF